ncbi:MAG: GNAT family N-acetyltransferase [Eubacteriales bacterium]|nr:GNAT family N-acetyltransferase [Eubacteriales bacterium]
MAIILKEAKQNEIELIWKMQVEGFTDLLEKYQDYDMSPATESLERITEKFHQPWTTYYFITVENATGNNQYVGVVRVINKEDGSRKRISPLWIMPAYRNKGYAQQAMLELEKIYGSKHWSLDTILQEKGNLHLYEKMGYIKTGKIEHINDRMDIVFYEKN